MVRGLVMLLIFQSLRGLTERHTAAHDVGGPFLPDTTDPEGERDGLKVSLHSEARVLSPGEKFRMTAVVGSGLGNPVAHRGVWLGLQILRAQSFYETSDSPPNHAVTWERVEDGKAAWAVALEDEGTFTASVLARMPCDTVDEDVHAASSCFLPLPLRQEGQVQLTVTSMSAQLMVSWDQTQTVEALSGLAEAPQGVLRVFAVASDGLTVKQAFKSPVQIVAVDDTADNYSNLQNVLGGTTTSKMEKGVAEFPNLHFLLPGIYSLVALADGARAGKSAPIVVTPALGGILRFCEEPPALVMFPPIAPMRVAVEVVRASGERDSSFDGQVELQLEGAGFHTEPMQQRHKVQCHHGLCLWNRLVLNVAAGQYRLKAAVVHDIAGSLSATKDARLLTPAFSAPIQFQKSEQGMPGTGILEYEFRGDVQKDAEQSLRVGQPWDAEVAIGSAPQSLPEDILLKESLNLNRPASDYFPVNSLQRSSTASVRMKMNTFKHLRSRGRLLERLKRRMPEHKIQLSVADSSQDDYIALSGDVIGTTNEIGVALIKGLSFWLKGNATSGPQSLWVKLRAVCVTCRVTKHGVRPAIESSKVYINASAAVGVYLDPTAALVAVSRWQHAKPLAKNKGDLPMSLPGRPAQVCVQLFERPSADVLITVHPEDKLFHHGSASVRVTPYTWPQPACWHFEGISQQLHETTPATYQKITLQLHSADALYGNRELLSWKGLAAPDGTVPIIVLPSRAIPRRSRLLHSLRWISFRKLEFLRGQNVEKPIWLDLQEGPLQGSARLLLLPSEAADEQGYDNNLVTALQLQKTNLLTALLWRSAAVIVELVTPKTHVMLEFTALGNTSTEVHVKGKCINKDAGEAIMSTIDKHILSARQDLPPLHNSEEHTTDQNQLWQQLELTLDWKRLASENAGILQHHVVCEFHATAKESMVPLRLLPKASVDIIATGFSCQNDKKERCSSGTYAPIGSGRCLPCPEDAVCADPAESPKPCSFGWQRRGEETECTPCEPGRMCKASNGSITRAISEILCPQGTYTKAEYPGVCIPCPPGFQCPNPAESPQPCPSGTSSLGGQKSCSVAPEGLIVAQGREHLPPRPCEDGLTPLELDGIWFCGLDYSLADQMREELPEHIRSSLGDSPVFTASRPFPLGCDVEYLNHTWCFNDWVPSETWCPYFGATRYPFPLKWATSVYTPYGGGYSQHFTTCGYHQRRRVLGDRVSWYGGVGGRNDEITDLERPGEYQCWKGYTCKGKHHFPWPCVPGTYSNADRTACINCPAGWPCPMARTSEDQLVVACWPGHYCPEGSASPTAKPCPPGTVNHGAAAEDVTACKTCPAGWICSGRAFQAVGFEACPAGHYCGEGALKGTPCPAGTHAPFSGASSTMKSLKDCIPCVAGYYCPEGSDLLQMLSRPCPAGRVCPPGTGGNKVPKCPPGFYSPVVGLTDKWECTPCPAGHYCDYGDDDSAPHQVSGQCRDGLMSLNTGKFGDAHSIRPIEPKAGMDAQCVECDPGYKCIGGMRTPCGRGYFSEGGTDCQKCEAGRYCSEEVTTREQMEEQKCPAGAFCGVGVDSVPWVASHPCPRGNYCPEVIHCNIEGGKQGNKHYELTKAIKKAVFCVNESSLFPVFLCPKHDLLLICSTLFPVRSIVSFSRPRNHQLHCECMVFEGYQNSGWVSSWNGQPKDRPGQLGGCVTISNCRAERPCSERPIPHPPILMGKCGACCSVTGRLKLIVGDIFKTATSPTMCSHLKEELGATTKSYCEPGKYNPNPGASSIGDCIPCPAGYVCTGSHLPEPDGPCSAGAYCTGGALSSRQYVAEVGYYAPEGSSMQYLCKPGSFAPHTGLAECYLCPPGWITTEEGQEGCRHCFEGHYCPKAGLSSAIKCPAGTYRDTGHAASIAGCHQCPPFMACTHEGLGSKTFVNCEPGYYCIYGSSSPRPENTSNDYDINKAGPCPRGFYCEGDKPPVPCPRGTLGLNEKQTNVDQCVECPGGTECAALGGLESEICPEGFLCPVRTVNARRKENLCPEGHQCQAGSDSGRECPKGTFAPFKGMAKCLKCPAGFLCESRSTEYESQSCQKGHFCLEAATEATPCPIGTVGLATNLSSESLCLMCPPGHYCSSTSREDFPGVQECPAGTYSSPGAKSKEECVKCPTGSFCPQSASIPIPCPAGMLCANTGLHEAEGECPAGKFCKVRANEATQEQVCIAGAYCPEGSPGPLLCPIGKYSPTTGAQNDESCEECPAGRSEHRWKQQSMLAMLQGKYCPPGAGEQGCRIGTFNPLTGMQSASSCLSCLPGWACTQEGLSEPDEKCAGGHYCNSGASTAEPEEEWNDGGSICTAGFICPEGSISPIPCPSGSYCPTDKASSPEGQCSPGHYCAHHAIENESTEQAFEDECPSDIKQGICPPGAVCPKGSSFPFKCPAEQHSVFELWQFVCLQTRFGIPCPIGHFCNQEASAPQECPARSYQPSIGAATCEECPAGDGKTECLPGARCPVGYYCPAGSTTPISCPAGTTGIHEGAKNDGQCAPCPANMFCPPGGGQWPCHSGFVCTGGASVPRPMKDAGRMCLKGHECKAGEAETPCSRGTYADVEKRSQCTICSPGKYCNVAGLDGPVGSCQAGYYCQAGATKANYEDEAWPDGSGKCPPGHYCPAGSAAPTRCPPGTFKGDWGGEEVSDCTNCTGGKFCGKWGLVEPEGDCKPGEPKACCLTSFYCKGGSSTPTPLQEMAGDLCPKGATECLPCPKGYMCTHGTAEPSICPAGFYCEEGQKPKLCPDGTKSTFSGLSEGSQCIECGSGEACDGTQSLGSCKAGYLCLAGVGPSLAPPLWQQQYIPAGVQLGGPCPVGHFCPEGAKTPTACSRGSSTVGEGGVAAGDCVICNAGWYCSLNSAGVLECPAGSYCPRGSIGPIECPAGTYNLSPMATDKSSCLKCPAGYACMPGTVDYLQWPCPVGYYCPKGSGVAFPCEQGTYEDSTGDALCPAGNYCPGGTEEPLPCPQSYYCPEGSASPGACPDGSLCPAGVKEPILCPAGTYKEYFTDCVKKPSIGTCCEMCPPGTFAPSSGASACEPCPAGYLCYGGTATYSPQLPDVDKGEPCPVGHYCPPGSSAPEPCPAGTYNDKEAGGNLLEACKPCESDTYSDSPGQSGCYACGPTSTAEAGATTCSCLGRHRWFQGIQGSCVCEGGYESYGLTGNSLSNVDSALDCQPIVRDNCSGSQLAQLVSSSKQLRDSEGYCVDPSTCQKNCTDSKGGFVLLAGQCMCLPLRDADVACDAECKRTLVKAYYQDGALHFKSDVDGSVGKLQVADLSANGRALGSIECQADTVTDCAVHFYSARQDKIIGLFGTPESLQKEAELRQASSGAASSELTRSRRLALLEGIPAVDNPVQCLQLYDTVAWRLEEDTYPVFLKDSLLNSNVAIDLSVFAEVESAFQSRRDAEGQDIMKQWLFFKKAKPCSCITTLLPPFRIRRYPGVSTPSSLAKLGVHIYSASNVEPDLTIVMLTLGCVFLVLVVLLVSISAARRLQSRKRQAVDQKGDHRTAAKVFGGRSAAIKAKRRLEALLADIIEQRLIKVDTEKVLSLEPRQLDDMLSEIQIAAAQPQAFEMAFGALHQMSVKLNSFFSKGGNQYQRVTRDLAAELSQMQKNALKMLELIKERIQQRGRLSEQMGPMLEGVSRLLGELRSADLFINAVASSTETSNSDEGQQALLLKMLASCTNIGVSNKLHLRLLHAAVDGMRYTAQDADRVYLLAGIKRMFNAPSATSIAQEHLEDADDVLLEGGRNLIKAASKLLNEGCELLSSSRSSKQCMKAQLLEGGKRENEILRAACKQFSASFDTAVATALQGLVEQEDQILQLHLSRLAAVASAASREAGENPANLERFTKALHAHSTESKTHFKKAVKDCSVAFKQSLEQQREVQVSALLEQRVREEDDCLEEIHRFERQLVLAAIQLSIHSALRAEALNLRRQIKQNDIEESEYRKRKASLASSLDSNIQRLTRERFSEKAARIADYESEAMRVYEQLMDAIHKRQQLEKTLRREQVDALVRLVRRKQRHAWSGAALEKKLLYASVEESWSRMAENQERYVEHALKETRQQAEFAFEGLLELSRELQSKRLKENLAEMASLRREQEKEIEEAFEEQKEAIVLHREKWMQALVHEANLHTEAQGKLQALGERHALAAATSCLEAASQSLYHDAAAEEKDRADLELLAYDKDDEKNKLFQKRVADSLILLKSTMDEEFQRRVDVLQSSFQQHQTACEQARTNIMEAHRQLLELQTANVCSWTDGPRCREEDFLSWQSGQLSERFEATALDDGRLKQPRSADWEACCHLSAAKAIDVLQDVSPDPNGIDETPLPGLHQLGLSGELISRTRVLMGNISAAQKSIVVGEAEWLEKCRGIQGGSQAAAAQDSKRKRAQNMRLQHMRESFRSKAVELRNEYDGEIHALLEEEKEAETRLNRSQQAEEANLNMIFRIKEASIDSPEELEELREQRQQAIAELLRDFQAQRDSQKGEIQQRLDNAKAALREKHKQLCQQFEESKQEACKEFFDFNSSAQEKDQNFRKAKLVEAARLNPSASNIYALHTELKDQHRDNLNSLVVKQMQDRAKFRHKVGMEMRAAQSEETDAVADNCACEVEAWYNLLKGLTRHRTKESYQEKIRQLQEAAQDAAMQDEALALEEQHLSVLIDTLNEFASTGDSPASGLIEQALQEKVRLGKEREDLRQFVSERLLEAEKLTRGACHGR
ncbi:hypothetical protein Emag_006751 [Eimeria magna]